MRKCAWVVVVVMAAVISGTGMSQAPSAASPASLTPQQQQQQMNDVLKRVETAINILIRPLCLDTLRSSSVKTTPREFNLVLVRRQVV